jgi:hypothetical protein
MLWNRMYTLDKTKRIIIRSSKFNFKNISWPKQGHFNANSKKVIAFVLEKYKNGLHITTEAVWTKTLEVTILLKFPQQNFEVTELH